MLETAIFAGGSFPNPLFEQPALNDDDATKADEFSEKFCIWLDLEGHWPKE